MGDSGETRIATVTARMLERLLAARWEALLRSRAPEVTQTEPKITSCCYSGNRV